MFEASFPWTEWDPFQEMDRVRRRFGRILDETPTGARAGTAYRAEPRVQVFDAGEAFVVEADLPGFRNEDVTLTVEKDVLTLTGKRPVELREGYSVHRRERPETRLAQSFAMPSRVDAEHVTATLKGGVLTVRLPKVAQERPRQINVKVS